MYEPNPVKSDRNLAKHGVSFEDAAKFDWKTAIEARDIRRPYAEVRSVASGLITARLHVMVFTRRGLAVRIISLRRANRREIAGYVDFEG